MGGHCLGKERDIAGNDQNLMSKSNAEIGIGVSHSLECIPDQVSTAEGFTAETGENGFAEQKHETRGGRNDRAD